MPIRASTKGFTLVELMVVVAIIGVLTSIAIPNFIRFLERAKVTRTAAELVNIGKGFEMYAGENTQTLEGYPVDSHLVLPPGMDGYVDATLFTSPTPLGGNYNWEGPDNYPYAGIAIQNPNDGDRLMIMLDAKIDDGDLTTGRFRKTPNGRYTFMLWEK